MFEDNFDFVSESNIRIEGSIPIGVIRSHQIKPFISDNWGNSATPVPPCEFDRTIPSLSFLLMKFDRTIPSLSSLLVKFDRTIPNLSFLLVEFNCTKPNHSVDSYCFSSYHFTSDYFKI